METEGALTLKALGPPATAERDTNLQLAKSTGCGWRGMAMDWRARKVNLRITSQLLTGRGLGQLPVILLLSKTCFYVQTTVRELGGRFGHLFIQQALRRTLNPPLNTALHVKRDAEHSDISDVLWLKRKRTFVTPGSSNIIAVVFKRKWKRIPNISCMMSQQGNSYT